MHGHRKKEGSKSTDRRPQSPHAVMTNACIVLGWRNRRQGTRQSCAYLTSSVFIVLTMYVYLYN